MRRHKPLKSSAPGPTPETWAVNFLNGYFTQGRLEPLDQNFAKWFREKSQPKDSGLAPEAQGSLWKLIKRVFCAAKTWMGAEFNSITSEKDFCLLALKRLSFLFPLVTKDAEREFWLPPWMDSFWRRRKSTGDFLDPQNLADLEGALSSPESALFLRMNQPAKEAEVQQELRKNDFDWKNPPPSWSLPEGWGVEIRGRASVYNLSTFREGFWEIQDLGSQRAAALLPLFPGQRILDFCAGEGGKTLALASRMGGRGALWALDIKEYKLKKLKTRAAKAGFFMVRTLLWDGSVLPPWGKEIESRKGFDSVIVDAPCTATGTWNKDPEARFRTFPPKVEEMTKIQDGLLDQAWKALKPKGHLLYITCSWLVEENEERVEHFLSRTKDARLEKSQWFLSTGSGVYFGALLVKDSVPGVSRLSADAPQTQN